MYIFFVLINMKIKLNNIAALIFMSIIHVSYARAEGSFKPFYKDSAALTCHYWNKARAANDASSREDEAWVLGFASGVSLFWNSNSKKIMKITNYRLFKEVDRRCQKLERDGFLDDVILDIIRDAIIN